MLVVSEYILLFHRIFLQSLLYETRLRIFKPCGNHVRDPDLCDELAPLWFMVR